MSYKNLAWCMPQNSLKVLGGTVSFAPLMGLWFAMITRDSPTVSTTKINQQNRFAWSFQSQLYFLHWCEQAPTELFRIPLPVNSNLPVWTAHHTSLIVLLLDNSMYKRAPPQQWGGFWASIFWFMISDL